MPSLKYCYRIYQLILELGRISRGELGEQGTAVAHGRLPCVTCVCRNRCR
eukprot:COSAG01_NODE_38415_length_489_cov_327.474359_1_plen_49_part_01